MQDYESHQISHCPNLKKRKKCLYLIAEFRFNIFYTKIILTSKMTPQNLRHERCVKWHDVDVPGNSVKSICAEKKKRHAVKSSDNKYLTPTR